jgi:hypothetical protein
MPAKVILTVSEGDSAGDNFVFTERTTCLVGRHDSCGIRITEKDNPRRISRHHCLLDINPPDVRIRDFGSRNGTYVNGKLIGKRNTIERVDGVEQVLPEVDLKDGDEIRIRNTVLRVSIHVPVLCDSCSVEIPDENVAASQIEEGVHQCLQCRQFAATERLPSVKSNRTKTCARCSRDVAAEIGELRFGQYVCRSCRNDPLEVLKAMLDSARSGQKELAAIEGYSIIKELGRGGFGIVCLARHEKTGEQVALKIMLPDVAADDKAVGDFLREMRTTQALAHENVVHMRDTGCADGTFFMTLEFCNSGGLDRLISSRQGKVTLKEAAPIILEVLDGLEYAHSAKVTVKLADGSTEARRGIVHRDLKPQNIFLHTSGNRRIAKVGDYGMAKAFDAAGLSGHTIAGAVGGTPVFMCRQQVTDFKGSQPDVDVWAAAATFYFMLTGQYTRDFRKGKDVFQTILQDPVVPINDRDASIPKRLADLIDTALDDRDKLYFKTARDFKKALLGVL